MKIKHLKLIIVLMMGLNLNIKTQEKKIALWEDKIPGEIIVNYEENEVYKDNELESQ